MEVIVLPYCDLDFLSYFGDHSGDQNTAVVASSFMCHTHISHDMHEGLVDNSAFVLLCILMSHLPDRYGRKWQISNIILCISFLLSLIFNHLETQQICLAKFSRVESLLPDGPIVSNFANQWASLIYGNVSLFWWFFSPVYFFPPSFPDILCLVNWL